MERRVRTGLASLSFLLFRLFEGTGSSAGAGTCASIKIKICVTRKHKNEAAGKTVSVPDLCLSLTWLGGDIEGFGFWIIHL